MPCIPHYYWVFGFSDIILYGHSSARYLKYLGFDLKDIQTWLRHGDIRTTMNVYVDLDLEDKRSIAKDIEQRFQNFDVW